MSLEEFYYVSQIVASIAVLASLIYLALQTRQTARNQQAQMHIMRFQFIRDFTFKIGDRSFGETFSAGMEAEPGMSAAQSREFFLFVYSLIQSFEEQFYERREGMIDARRWDSSRSALKAMLARPGFRAVYKIWQSRLDKDFVALADTLIAEAKKEPTPPDIVAVWQMLAASERASATATA
jgi:hypothetical protein